jgi:DNA end-binding protein Ku
MSKFEDGYEVALKELVNAKANHLPVPQDEAITPNRGSVINLMDALRRSVGADAKASASSPKKKSSAGAKDLPNKGLGLVNPNKTPMKRKSA